MLWVRVKEIKWNTVSDCLWTHSSCCVQSSPSELVLDNFFFFIFIFYCVRKCDLVFECWGRRQESGLFCADCARPASRMPPSHPEIYMSNWEKAALSTRLVLTKRQTLVCFIWRSFLVRCVSFNEGPQSWARVITHDSVACCLCGLVEELRAGLLTSWMG